LLCLALPLAPAWGLDAGRASERSTSPDSLAAAALRTDRLSPAPDPAQVLLRTPPVPGNLLGERLRLTLDPLPASASEVGASSDLRLRGASSLGRHFAPPQIASSGHLRSQQAYRSADHTEARARAGNGLARGLASSTPGLVSQPGLMAAAAAPAKTGESQRLSRLPEETSGADPTGSALKAVWQLGPNASLSSSQDTVRNDRRTDKKLGLTTTDSKHDLVLALSGGSEFKASFAQHREEWSRAFDKPSKEQRNSSLELLSKFGPAQRNSLRLALTSQDKVAGGSATSQGAREAHLSVAPSGALRLNADYVAKSSSQGKDQSARTLGAVLNLASDCELSAQVKALSAEGGSATRESSLKLNTKLGGGASAGNLTGERTTKRTEGSGPVDKQKWQLRGGLGSGATRTNVSFRLDSQRGEGPAATLKRLAGLHVDRNLLPGIKLVADRELKTTGTNEAPIVSSKSDYKLETKLGSATTLKAGLCSHETTGQADQRRREFSLEHRIGAARLQAERRYWGQEADARASTGYTMDLVTGELPPWAKNLSRAHAFDDASKYMVGDAPKWLDLPFAGLRVWTERRRGGEDGGRHTVGVSHSRLIAHRYQVQLTYQRLPEATEGSHKGRPLLLHRQMAQIGTPLGRGLIARARYGLENSTVDPLSRRQTGAIGLWGKLADDRSVEVSVARDRGSWEGRCEDRTGVGVLYSQEAGEDQRILVKAGYSWGEDDATGRGREARLTLSYAKPI